MSNTISLPRGLRNNNPGNIKLSPVKYLGENTYSRDKIFKEFQSIDWGYRAMFVVLHSYSLKGYKTIEQMINRYAPPVENKTNKYIDFVCAQGNIGVHDVVDTQDEATMVAIVSAMSQLENGVPADKQEVCSGWNLFVKHKP